MSKSWIFDIVFRPLNWELLVCGKESTYPCQSIRNILNLQVRGLPVNFQVASSIVAYIDNYLGLNGLVVPNVQSHIGLVAAHVFPRLFLWGWRRRHYDDGGPVGFGFDNLGRWGRRSAEALGVDNNLIGSNIEGLASSQGDGFISGSVTNCVLSDELKGPIIFIFFKHPDCALRKSYAQFVFFCILNFYFIDSLFISLAICSSAETKLIVFSNFHPIDFGEKLYLLLRFVVEGNWITESVEVIIWEGLWWKGRSSWSTCISTIWAGLFISSE